MIRKGDCVQIQALAKAGVYQKDIAAKLGVHPKTVSRALARNGAPKGRRERGFVKLAPHVAQVDQLLSEGVWNAVVIVKLLKAKGHTGSISQLKRYVSPKRVLRQSRATVRFETDPGRQLQSDWGQVVTRIGGLETKAHFIVNTLGWSRRMHVWAADREDAEHTYEGLVRTFEYFGGVTREVLVDNQRCAVLEHRAGEAPRFHPQFVDLAGHYGFEPRACKPARARTKGKDERMVGYVKQHFFQLHREFESFAHLNQLLEQWLHEVADPRVHGTVREVVAERFAREAPHLGALPAVRYDTRYREQRIVGWDAFVEVRGNRYSVPGTLAGRGVTACITLDGVLSVYDGDTVVAEHRLQPREAGWVTVPGHHASLWRDTVQVQQRTLITYDEAASWN